MSSVARTDRNPENSRGLLADADASPPDIAEAEAVLLDLARVFAEPALNPTPVLAHFTRNGLEPVAHAREPNPEAKYRALLEQIPAVVFMAYLDRGIREAYVSPQIEAALGYSREEWLEDPVRWYQHIHPDDKQRWSLEAAEMFLSGKPLRSAYRVIARDGRVIWFRCDARMMRWEDGRPWCIHGVAFDISDIKRIEEELQEERNFVSAILDTLGHWSSSSTGKEKSYGLTPPVNLRPDIRWRRFRANVSGTCFSLRKRKIASGHCLKCCVRIFFLTTIRPVGSRAMETNASLPGRVRHFQAMEKPPSTSLPQV
jgi:PAS domain S-box-containing protein